MTHNDYIIKITNTMQIRSTNYRLSQNDITLMISNVFEEIATACNLELYEQQVLIDSLTSVYDLDALYTTVGNEYLMEIVKIIDDEGYNLSKFFRESKGHVFTVDPHAYDNINDLFLAEYNSRYVTFVRRTIPDIETLSTQQQMLLFDTIIHGIMYYTHVAIPNPTASDTPNTESKSYYQVYMKSMDNLKNRFPQVA